MTGNPSAPAHGTAVNAAELALGLRVLADLVGAGLPIARALPLLAEITPHSWYGALPLIRRSVKEGRSLAGALSEPSLAIPAPIIGIIAAGERGDGLGPALRRAADLAETSAIVRSATRAALLYPTVLAVIGSISVVVMVGLLLPRFAAILADLGQSLPPLTRIMLVVAEVARAAFLPTVVGALLASSLLARWIDTEKGRHHWHAFLRRLPWIGPTRLATTTARTTSVLAALHESGVPIPRALRFAARAAGDAIAEARLLATRELVGTGHSLSRALNETNALTPLAVRLARAGEASGRLAPMLAHAAKIEQERANRITRDVLRLLEPALILVVAIVVGAVAAALLQAVYGVRPTP